MAPFEVGMLFSSYQEFKTKLDEYQTQNSVQVIIKSSKTVDAAKKNFPDQHINEALVYRHITFGCSDCFKNRNYFKSIDVQFDVEMNIRLAVTKDGQYLEVRKVNLKHSHPPGKKSKLQSLSMTRLKRDTDTVDVPVDFEVEPDITVENKSPERRRKRKLHESIVDLGKQIQRWQKLRGHLSVNSDEEFAEVLLNLLEKDLDISKPSPRDMDPCTRPSFVFVSQMSVGDTPDCIDSKDDVGVKNDSEDKLTPLCSIKSRPNTSFEKQNDLVHVKLESHDYKHGHNASSSTSKTIGNSFYQKDVIIVEDDSDQEDKYIQKITDKNLKLKSEPLGSGS